LKLHDKNNLISIPIPLPTISIGQPLATVILTILQKQRLKLLNGDVVAVASKVVSTCERRVVPLKKIKTTSTARRLAKSYNIDERLTTVVLHESDRIFGGVKGFLLTLKDGILTANAGVDLKNAPPGTAILWPKNPDASAGKLRRSLERRFHCHIGVEIVDSRVTPLRLGTTGLAIGLSGFLPVRDERRNMDLYGRRIKVTQTNVADDIASSAHLLMGEAANRVGVVVIRNAPITFAVSDGRQALMDLEKCLVGSSLVNSS